MATTAKNSTLTATWLVITSGTLYGTLGYFGTQLLNQDFAISTMLFWRFFIATLWMLFWEFKNHSLSELKTGFTKAPILLLYSGLLYAASSGFYFFASQETGTGLAMVIFFAYPIFVAISVWASNQWRVNSYSAGSLLVVCLGLYLLQKNHQANISLLSTLFALLASLAYALYICKSKDVLNNLRPGQFTILICLINTLLFFFISVGTQQFALPSTPKAWLFVLGIGIFATAIPIQLLLDGIKIISLIKASILSALEPIVTLIVGVFALNEIITLQQFLGVIVIIVGTIVIQFSRE
jgi:drug/metabolite transporter (DMT)-like permease